jgi:hypothetical protein
MGLCKLFVKTIVANTSVLQNKMVIYVRVPTTNTGYSWPGGRSSDCSVSCIAQLPSGSLVFIVRMLLDSKERAFPTRNTSKKGS